MWHVEVSIVSIQADQSRQSNHTKSKEVKNEFQSYQFRQINPDQNHTKCVEIKNGLVSIVSIQADQSRLLIWVLKQSH